eukprot:469179-Pleurochrysis_carterae.AAC.2
MKSVGSVVFVCPWSVMYALRASSSIDCSDSSDMCMLSPNPRGWKATTCASPAVPACTNGSCSMRCTEMPSPVNKITRQVALAEGTHRMTVAQPSDVRNM